MLKVLNGKTLRQKIRIFNQERLRAYTSLHGDADFQLLLMELPWRFQGQKFGIRNSIGISNSELMLMEFPWRFHEQKFGIGISIDRSLGPKSYAGAFWWILLLPPNQIWIMLALNYFKLKNWVYIMRYSSQFTSFIDLSPLWT